MITSRTLGPSGRCAKAPGVRAAGSNAAVAAAAAEAWTKRRRVTGLPMRLHRVSCAREGCALAARERPVMSGAKCVERLIENHTSALRIERRCGPERLLLIAERARAGLRLVRERLGFGLGRDRLRLRLGRDRLGVGLRRDRLGVGLRRDRLPLGHARLGLRPTPEQPAPEATARRLLGNLDNGLGRRLDRRGLLHEPFRLRLWLNTKRDKWSRNVL